MITKPNIQKRKIDKRLKGYTGSTAATNLSHLSEEASDRILGAANIDENDEEILLVSHRSDSDWCLLTSKRLIWWQNKELHSLSWKEIAGAQQPPAQSAQIIRGELRSDQVSDLEIFDSTGNKLLLQLEPGEVYYIIWSAILDFCNYVRRPDPITL